MARPKKPKSPTAKITKALKTIEAILAKKAKASAKLDTIDNTRSKAYEKYTDLGGKLDDAKYQLQSLIEDLGEDDDHDDCC